MPTRFYFPMFGKIFSNHWKTELLPEGIGTLGHFFGFAAFFHDAVELGKVVECRDGFGAPWILFVDRQCAQEEFFGGVVFDHDDIVHGQVVEALRGIRVVRPQFFFADF